MFVAFLNFSIITITLWLASILFPFFVQIDSLNALIVATVAIFSLRVILRLWFMRMFIHHWFYMGAGIVVLATAATVVLHAVALITLLAALNAFLIGFTARGLLVQIILAIILSQVRIRTNYS